MLELILFGLKKSYGMGIHNLFSAFSCSQLNNNNNKNNNKVAVQ